MNKVQRSGRPFTRSIAYGALCASMALAASSAATTEDPGRFTIAGTVRVAPEAAGAVRPDDRLILKLYHPGDGVEMDSKFAILTDFTLPMAFRIAPSIRMSGRARWPNYVVEAFTDNDRDIVSIAPGELYATSTEALPLGTDGVVLVLAPRQP